MRKIVTILILLISLQASSQQIKISGTISDAATKQPIEGAIITVKDKLSGTSADAKGNFTFTSKTLRLPFTIIISSVNHEEREVNITSGSQIVAIELKQKTSLLDEVVVAPTRVPENILRSPVSIEKMNLKMIQE